MKKKKIKEFVEKRQAVTVSFKNGLERLFLFPLWVNKNVLVGYNIVDFQIDGFKIINIKNIDKIKSNEADSFHQQIMKKEHIEFDLHDSLCEKRSFYELLNYIKDEKYCIHLTTGKTIKGRDFFVGQIQKVKEKTIVFLPITPMGELEKKMKVKLEDISEMDVKARYGTILGKYSELEE